MRVKTLLYFLTMILVMFAFIGCDDVPQQEIDDANAALEAAKKAEADRYVPDKYNAAKQSLDRAMAVVQEAKRMGTVRHIGVTSHSLDMSIELVKSDYFETIMFPLNFVTSEAADKLLPLAREHDVGYIAMKPLAGGALQNATIAFKYLMQFPDAVPIPGIEKVEEIEEIVDIIMTLNQQEKIPILLVEQNVKLALTVALHGYVMENGRVVMDDTSEKLRENADIRDFYLGLTDIGSRKSFRDVKHYKRRKRWLT